MSKRSLRSATRNLRWAILECLIVVAFTLAGEGWSAPRIELAEFRVEPTELKLGEPFVVHARAVATGVRLGSFLLRTADDVPRGTTIPGVSLYADGKVYVAEDGKFFLTDNGKLDEDPRDLAFALTLSTAGWKDGTYAFAFFASCRPSKGPFVIARHDFAVVVQHDRVLVEDLGPGLGNRNRAITAFRINPATVDPGAQVTLSVETGKTQFRDLQLTNPYYIADADTLSGFYYDASKKKMFFGARSKSAVAGGIGLTADPTCRDVKVKLDTTGWPPGVHHLLLNAIGFSGRPIDNRSCAIKVRSPHDQLDVTVEESRYFMPDTHFGSFIKLRDGTLLCRGRYSTDKGRTWKLSEGGGFGAGGEQLADGTVVGLDYRCLPEAENEGWYGAARLVSIDDGRVFKKTTARFLVPDAKAAMGHGPHVGPLFMRSIVQRNDGTLVALMAGWFKSDTALCPYDRGRPYSRSYVCQSSDLGRTWRYLTNIGYEHIGSEGYNEGSMQRLPNGRLLAVLRTGNEHDFNCQDNPIMWSVSGDEGNTWSAPRRTGVEGAYPCLAVLSDGMLAMSYGRPGAMLVFSCDGGRTWTDQTLVDATPYSGYTGVVEIDHGALLVGFGAKDYLDPKTGKREDQLRLVRVQYKKRSSSSGFPHQPPLCPTETSYDGGVLNRCRSDSGVEFETR